MITTLDICYVTGTSGFIGSACSRHLSEAGMDVINVNLREPHTLFRNYPRRGVFIHAASHPRADIIDLKSANTNVDLTKLALFAANLVDARRIIYISSACVYGRPPKTRYPCELDHSETPDYYGWSKFQSEQIIEHSGFDRIILRLPGVFGSGDRQKSIIGRLLNSGKCTGKITISGDGSQIRDFLCIDRLVKAIEYAVKGRIPTGIYNLANGDPRSIFEIANLVNYIFRLNATIEIINKGNEYDLALDIEKIKGICTEFKQPMRIDAGLNRLYKG